MLLPHLHTVPTFALDKQALALTVPDGVSACCTVFPVTLSLSARSEADAKEADW